MNGFKVTRWWRTLQRSRWYLGLSMVSPGLQYVLLDAGHHPEIGSLVTSGELSWPVPTTTSHVHPVNDWEQWLQPMLQRLSITNPSTGLQICCAIDGTLSWQQGVTSVPLQKRYTWLKRQASSALGVAAQHCSVDYLELEPGQLSLFAWRQTDVALARELLEYLLLQFGNTTKLQLDSDLHALYGQWSWRAAQHLAILDVRFLPWRLFCWQQGLLHSWTVQDANPVGNDSLKYPAMPALIADESYCSMIKGMLIWGDLSTSQQHWLMACINLPIYIWCWPNLSAHWQLAVALGQPWQLINLADLPQGYRCL